ncbi:MAG: hypothetical protein HGA90_02920, partial [Alphaproteobacteria bacterium]|nr:hypothetical protein [Alphaproteobacteria bacterium]
KALKSAPENISALRARGHAWLKLGQESKAKRDFEKVEALENPEGQNKQ